MFFKKLKPPLSLKLGSKLQVPITGYDGSRITQHVHPSILKLKSTLHDASYLLAVTPFPYNDEKYEHVSVSFSKNLLVWFENGVKNPIAYNPKWYNADPHLTYDPAKHLIIVYYMRVLDEIKRWRVKAKKNAIFAKCSPDGLHWSNEVKVLEGIDYGVQYLSPSVIYDAELSKFLMWVIINDKVSIMRILRLYESDDGFRWRYVANCNVPSPRYGGEEWSLWHMSIRKVGGQYWMIASMNHSYYYDWNTPMYMFFFKSTNGIDWTGYDVPILDSKSAKAKRLYRADFIVENGILTLITSWQAHDDSWNISLNTVDISKIMNPQASSDNVVLLS
ncbi:MAG: hypothetical protein ACXQTB_01835 [Candidatus Nezhaarchaeales archaeon]